MASDEKVSEVVARVLAGKPAAPAPAELETCKARDCHRDLTGDGSYDGFCAPCAKERLRDGRWKTMPLVQQVESPSSGETADGAYEQFKATAESEAAVRLMAMANMSRTGYQPVTICLAQTTVPPSFEAMRFFKQVWTEDAQGRVVKVHKDNMRGDAKLRPGQNRTAAQTGQVSA